VNRVVFASLSTEWSTPQGVYAKLHEEFNFNFDPCPLGGDVDGLATLFCEWVGKRVFCNPPYGDISKWLRRAREADLAVFLIPARTDTKWFHGLILPYAKEIRFIKGRLTFGNAKNVAPFPSMVVVFRRQAGEETT
jgi:hypothetical protein